MIELTEEHFQQLCRAAPVAAALADMEKRRQAAVRRFWICLLGGAILGAALAWLLIALDAAGLGIVLGVALFVLGAALALRTMGKARQQVKFPVLRELAAIGGFAFADSDFEPPVYAEARHLLFGTLLSNQWQNDMLSGTDGEGRRWWTYALWLSHRATGGADTRFSGRVYAFDRRKEGGGSIVAVAERSLLRLGAPGGLERVRMDSDPDFEEAFDVFSENPAEAIGLLDRDARETLRRLREQGRLLLYAGPREIFVALGNGDPLEPGSMFRSIDPDARVRRIFDGVQADLAMLRCLTEVLD